MMHTCTRPDVPVSQSAWAWYASSLVGGLVGVTVGWRVGDMVLTGASMDDQVTPEPPIVPSRPLPVPLL
jgi:hypothetical protein